MTAPIHGAFLIWEDEDANSDRWWLSRARESAAADRRDFFIAEDDVTNVLVCVLLPHGARRYHVLSIVPLDEYVNVNEAIAVAKQAVVTWQNAPHEPIMRQMVQRWRLRRGLTLMWRSVPLIAAGFAVGGVLGLLVAVFAVTSNLIGWPMLVAGIVLGAAAGPLLKFLVDRRSAAATVSGPWKRFTMVTIAAILGAATFAGAVFTLFWS